MRRVYGISTVSFDSKLLNINLYVTSFLCSFPFSEIVFFGVLSHMYVYLLENLVLVLSLEVMNELNGVRISKGVWHR